MSATTVKPGRAYVTATLAVIALSVTASLLGLFREGHYDVEPGIVLRLQAQDAVILVVAVPALALALWTARRGSLRGRIAWLGALAYMTYVWSSITATTPFNEFFLGYVALFGLSLFTLVGGVAHTDPEPVQRALSGKISERLYAGVLAFIGVGLALLWLVDLVPATLAGTPPLVVEELGEGAVHTYVLDLGVVVPALSLTAGWLLQRRAWGYVFAGVLLVMAALLAPGLAAITAADALGDYVTLSTPLIVGTVLPPLVAAVLAVRYLLAFDGSAVRDREPADRRTGS
ncbi:hypothetical protein G9464_17165 [Halostella sp. JP-L12]|uniref:hypothetical protein n=1 Tax=Halostella TaxID=1843185 RepID=UPI000EF82A7F|nr:MULTISPECIES: hypothetical protein [Halostella]NHN49305.1 hypothetical protein [Halostella sp. JP-L12]